MATTEVTKEEEGYHIVFRNLLTEITQELENEHNIIINESFAVMMVTFT